MKKSFFSVLFLFLTTFCFAIDDINLYANKQLFIQIKNNRVYKYKQLIGEIKYGTFLSEEENSYKIRFTEDNTSLTFSFLDIDEDEIFEIFTFSKKTGQEIYYKSPGIINYFSEETGNPEKTIFLDKGKINYIFEFKYDENGNKSKQIQFDENEKLINTIEYLYDNKARILKQTTYDENNNLISYINYTYDDINKYLLEKTTYNKNNQIIEKAEYNPTNSNIKVFYSYDENNNLKLKKVYDENKIYNSEIERYIYNKPNQPEKWTFIKYDANHRYNLTDGYYLDENLFQLYELNRRDSNTFKHNEQYLAKYQKIKYDKTYSGYPYLKNLENNRYLFHFAFTLCNKNSLIYYVFETTEDNKIDYDNCYEIKLINTADYDYKSLNKSGKEKGPFGFDIGMSYEEVKAACIEEPQKISDDRYYVKPKKSHPNFEKYVVWISEKYGLYYIKAVSANIQTKEDGSDVKLKYENLKNTLSKKYGKSFSINRVNDSYLFKDNSYWMMSIVDGARVYQNIWYINGFIENDGIKNIYLGIENTYKYSVTDAYIYLEYDFVNSDAAKNFLDDVL